MAAKQFRRSKKKILTVNWTTWKWTEAKTRSYGKKFQLDVGWTISAIHFNVMHDSAMKINTYYFWLYYCLPYCRRFTLLCIKRNAPWQLLINCHFHLLNFPTVSSLLHNEKKEENIGLFLKNLAPKSGL